MENSPVAGHIIVYFLSDIDPVSTVTRELWQAIELSHKEPERDAEFGYESWHQVFIIPDHLKPDGWTDLHDMPATFEVQIRTLFMHAYAEPQHDFGYKSADELSRDQRRRLGWIASAAWGADRAFQEIVDNT